MHLYLILLVGGRTAALAAEAVDSVVEVEEVTPVPHVGAHVAGLFALRSRVLTVIDARASLGLAMVPRQAPLPAVIATVAGHSYALVVDEVEDVAEAPPPEPCPAVLTDGWAWASRGVIRHGERLLPLLDAAALIAGGQRAAA